MNRNPSLRTSLHRRQRLLGPTLALLLGMLPLAALAASPAARVEISVGDVEIGRGDPPTWEPARAGAPLAPGDRLRTGRNGRAEVRLPEATIRIFEGSVLRLPESGGDAERVEMERGLSLFDVLHREDRHFEVESPEVVVSVKGTRFGVQLGDAAARVQVWRGTVGVRAPGAEPALETLVREGFQATGGGGLPFDLQVAPRVDLWQGWKQGEVVPAAPDRHGSAADGRAVEEARAAAQRMTRREVVGHAMRRDPALARRVAARVAKRRARLEAGEAPGPAALAPADEHTGRPGGVRRGAADEDARDMTPEMLEKRADQMDPVHEMKGMKMKEMETEVATETVADFVGLDPDDPGVTGGSITGDPTDPTLEEVMAALGDLSAWELKAALEYLDELREEPDDYDAAEVRNELMEKGYTDAQVQMFLQLLEATMTP